MRANDNDNNNRNTGDNPRWISGHKTFLNSILSKQVYSGWTL